MLRNKLILVATIIFGFVAITMFIGIMIFMPPKASPHSIVVIDTLGLRNGDLLFRNGNGGESRLVTTMSNSNYSHIAFAHRAATGWHAVHAVPGETPSIHDIDYLKSEPIEAFYHYERACAGAVARVDCADSIAHEALSFALDKVARQFAFDHSYRLGDTTEYYCTELIYEAYRSVGINLADERRHELPMPGTDGYFIFPSDILSSPHISSLRVFQTQPSSTAQ